MLYWYKITYFTGTKVPAARATSGMPGASSMSHDMKN
jgi:hypothetical protein